MTNISNPLSSSKPVAFKAFEDLAKNASIENEATVHLSTDTGGRIVLGLEAKSPVAGKKTQALGKPITNLNKITDAQRNGLLATEAFKQAIVQRYGQNIANAVEKHLLKRGTVQILTAADLRRNLRVTAAIVKILKATPQTPAVVDKPSARQGQLSQSSGRRNDDGSPRLPSAPPRERSTSEASETSVDQFFSHREQPPQYRSTEELRPSAPPRSRNASEVTELDEAGNAWHHNPLFISPDQALELEAASLPTDPAEAAAARRPRSKSLSPEELDATFKEFEDLLKDRNEKTGKT
jgi:hypothetical protein